MQQAGITHDLFFDEAKRCAFIKPVTKETLVF